MKKLIIASTAILMGMTATANAIDLGDIIGGGGGTPGVSEPIETPGIYFQGMNGNVANTIYNGVTAASINVNGSEKLLEIPGSEAAKPVEFYGSITVGATSQQVNFYSMNKPGALLDFDLTENNVPVPEEVVFYNVGSLNTPSYQDLLDGSDVDENLQEN